MTPSDFSEFMHDYATHFGFYNDIVFHARVKQAKRNSDDTKWLLEVEIDGETKTHEFDKIAFCHGYQNRPVIPTFEGQDKFEGILMHSQQYRR